MIERGGVYVYDDGWVEDAMMESNPRGRLNYYDEYNFNTGSGGSYLYGLCNHRVRCYMNG